MKESLGQRIARLRKAQNRTQEDLAEKLGITAQAVSKWENDLCAPDISILRDLAAYLGVSVDYLLSGEQIPDHVRMNENAKKIEELILRIRVRSADGDNVLVNLPMPFILMLAKTGADLSGVLKAGKDEPLKGIDIQALIGMIEAGVLGKLVEIESEDGDHVEIFVE